MPVGVDSRCVLDAWLIPLASWIRPSANLLCRGRGASILIGSVLSECADECLMFVPNMLYRRQES